jgi:hypothetical protein
MTDQDQILESMDLCFTEVNSRTILDNILESSRILAMFVHVFCICELVNSERFVT